jgi:hypothetical protein
MASTKKAVNYNAASSWEIEMGQIECSKIMYHAK